MTKKIVSLILVLVAVMAVWAPVAQADYTGTDQCGLKAHSCSTHQSGKYYTEAIAFHAGMHAYQTDPACGYGTIGGYVPPQFGWQVVGGYRVMPYSADLHVSGTCPNCTYQLYCGTDSSHVSEIETD